jgi:hypothetical protein
LPSSGRCRTAPWCQTATRAVRSPRGRCPDGRLGPSWLAAAGRRRAGEDGLAARRLRSSAAGSTGAGGARFPPPEASAARAWLAGSSARTAMVIPGRAGSAESDSTRPSPPRIFAPLLRTKRKAKAVPTALGVRVATKIRPRARWARAWRGTPPRSRRATSA